MPPLSILAFEPFDTGSHRAVRESISRHSRHDWAWRTLPGRSWKWRMRLAAPTFARAMRAESSDVPSVDAIFATSLMSLADLVASLPVSSSTTRVLYMHENQAAYPVRHEDERDAHFALTNLTSMAAADLVIWNSDWNRRSFRACTNQLLRHAPDGPRDVAEFVDDARSVVIWPPVELPAESAPPIDEDRILHNPVRICWPHRWEHDKGPDELLRLATDLHRTRDVRWTILGERYRDIPPALIEFEKRFGEAIDHFGYAEDRADYRRHLRRCDWVMSTAHHEFFGMAVVEALLSGCLPWLPDRLSYPELLPDIARGLTPFDPPPDPATIRRAVCAHLQPAVAAQAVMRLDDAIEAAVARPRARARPRP